ncbi:MAG: hypothetical protein DWB45_14015, partial [Xanthomonadales bacterium]|nr:hypothetical protein [Xanthomonadales bacterium]MDL1870338.1 hypothetical protein [Gammaproteobacteria bacterium PRO6]
PRLLDELRARVRRLGLSLRTEEAYAGWVRRFVLANGKRHPGQPRRLIVRLAPTTTSGRCARLRGALWSRAAACALARALPRSPCHVATSLHRTAGRAAVHRRAGGAG